MPNSAFITTVPNQKNSQPNGLYKDEIRELEALVSGVTQTTQSTLLLKKKKEMREVSDSLAYMKQQYLIRMSTCDESHLLFEQKQIEMKDQVVKFEKFIQENDAKRLRAEMRGRDERRKIEIKQEEINFLNRQLVGCEDERKVKLLELSKLTKYKSYLDLTVDETSDGISQISDILNRLQTLEGANLDLMLLQKESDLNMDNVRIELGGFLTSTQNQVLVLNSKVHGYQNSLETLRSTSKKHRESEESSSDRVKDVNRETGQIIMAIRNLYSRCCTTTRTKMPTFSEKYVNNFAQLDKCLTFICERIVDLREVNEGHESNSNVNEGVFPPIHNRDKPGSKKMGSGRGRYSGGNNNNNNSSNSNSSVVGEESAYM